MTKDGYRITFPKKSHPVSVKDFLIPAGTIEGEIFHSYFSVILRELNLGPGEKLWRCGVSITKSKASYFASCPLAERKTRGIAKYIADCLGYDGQEKKDFKLYDSFGFNEDVGDLSVGDDSADKNPKSGNFSIDTTQESFEGDDGDDNNVEMINLNNDSKFVDPEDGATNIHSQKSNRPNQNVSILVKGYER